MHETRFRLEEKPCSKFLLEIYIYRGVPFLSFFLFFFCSSREEDLHFGKNEIVPREESVSRDCSRVPLSLSLPLLLFQILETVYFRWNSSKILKKNYQRERFVATLSERRKILEKEKKRKKRNYSNFIRKGIVSISRGTLYWNITGGEDDGVTGAVSKIAPNIRREAIKLQLVRLTIQSLDCNDPAHCFGAVTINEKLPATDLLQLSPKYQRIPIHPRLSPSPSVPNRLRFHPCKQANPFRPVSP